MMRGDFCVTLDVRLVSILFDVPITPANFETTVAGLFQEVPEGIVPESNADYEKHLRDMWERYLPQEEKPDFQKMIPELQ